MRKNCFLQSLLMCVFFITYNCKVLGQKKFTPDTTINSILQLRNISSFALFYPNTDSIVTTENLVFFDFDQPFVLFLNASKTEYLAAIVHEGTWKNYFSEFEIGKISDNILQKMNIPYIVTEYQNFQTESNIYVGISVKTLEQLKGRDYLRIGNKIKYCYNRLDSEFLEIGECEYYLECELIDNKIIKFRFGYTPL